MISSSERALLFTVVSLLLGEYFVLYPMLGCHIVRRGEFETWVRCQFLSGYIVTMAASRLAGKGPFTSTIFFSFSGFPIFICICECSVAIYSMNEILHLIRHQE